MTKLVQQPSTSAADQPIPEVSVRCDEQHQPSPQASSTPAKVASSTTTPTTPTARKHQQPQLSRRTSTRLTSIRNDSLSSSSSSSSLSSAGDLETATETKATPTEDVFKVPSLTPVVAGTGDDSQETGIVCRLPLDRLQAILGALNILKNPPDHELGNGSSPSPTYKLLCLYCDRTFTSQTLMSKHIDRVHRISKERRSSSRVLPTTSDGAFPSCSYCNKSKVLNPASEDLSQLFKHLVHQHADRYYACELCAVRFPSDESRDAHIEALHPPASTPETRTRPKSKAALKSFNVKTKKCDIVTTPLTIQVDFDTEAMKNLTIDNLDSVDSLSAALGLASTTTGANATRLRSSGRTSARSSTIVGASGKSKVFRKSDKMVMRPNEPMLSRLGIAQHRTPRQCRKALNAKNRRKAAVENASCSSTLSGTSSQPDNHYNKITKLKTIRSTLNNPSGSSESDFVVTRGKNDIVSTFDEDFYGNVNLNVRQNLSCHLDGKLEASEPNAPSPMSPVVAVPAIRSTVVRSPLQSESKIHEATNLPAMTVFPTLLTVEQYGTDLMPMSKIKKPITKNSWKWKWDFVKKYKYVNENGKIVKKIKQPTLGLRDLSKLDMWTQLTMRTKHEVMRNRRELHQPGSSVSDIGISLRKEQRKQVDELNHILDSRLIPQINLEQNDQSIIKLEKEPDDDSELLNTLSEGQRDALEMDETFTNGLNLLKIPSTNQQQRVVLSGEWARPRCYICYCCGDKFHSLKQMEEHKTFRHPYVYSTYYEIVGRELIEKQLFKHFFIPLSALTMHRIHYARLSTYPSLERRTPPVRQPSIETTATITEIKSEDSSSNEATSFSTATSSSLLSISGNTATSSGSSSSSRSALDTLLSAGNDFTTSFTNFPSEPGPVQCSKCQKECVNTLVLYAHVLNCSNDYIWLQAKKRMKNRRANRKRKRTNRASQVARKAQTAAQNAIEKSETASNHSGAEIDSSSISGSSSVSSDTKKKSKSPPRPRDSDSDIVKRITANLPPKRVSRQIIQTTKQIRKRPQMNMVKGKKQVVSTLAPSKAGVARGVTTVGITKLRSGKIATLPGSSKKVVSKVAIKKPVENVEPKEESNVSQESSNSKQTEKDNTKEEEEAVQTEEPQETKALTLVKRKVLSRDRTLSVRAKKFVTRRSAMHWKGKTKGLPFGKGIISNNRSLRSAAVKIAPVKRQRKNASPLKSAIAEEGKSQSASPVSKKSPSKRKGSNSPAELENNSSSSKEEKSLEQDKKAQPNETTGKIPNESPSNSIEDANTDEAETTETATVIEEVPKECLNTNTADTSMSSTLEDNPQHDVSITRAQSFETSQDRLEPSSKSNEGDLETPNQPISQDSKEPSTPVKSPNQGSQPPSEPSTPTFSASQQANKRKPKKLNDCIAMLTGKLTERLGVDFFNQVAAKNQAPKQPSPTTAVETRSSKQVILPAPSLEPLPPVLSVPLHVTPPQLNPLPLVMNTRQSPVAPKPQMLSPIAPIITPMDEISDEPLNLSKNSPIARTIPTRLRELYSHQKTTNLMSPPPPQSPTALHSPQQLPSPHYHQPSQVQQQQQQHQQHPGPSAPARNLPSIKLPPGLIIERVEYKSRPTISKEAPSVTIVARRQPGPPPSMEHRSTVLMQSVQHERLPSPPSSSRKHSNPLQLTHQQQQYGDPRKSSAQNKPLQLSSPKSAPQPHYPTPSIASTLRQERPLENRISVTITEAKGERHLVSNAKQPPVTLNIPERPLVLDRSASNINPSPLIIPSVPVPSVPAQTPSPIKKNRRKSMYVSPVSIPEQPSPAPAPPVPPVLSQAFLSGLPSLPFLQHTLLAAPPLGLDLHRLAAVGLPPHLKPPVIPPLTIPTPPTTTAAAAAFLEKILLPNRDVIVKHVEATAALKMPTSPTPVSLPKSSTESIVPAVDVQNSPSAPTDLKSPIVSTVQQQQPGKKSRSRAKSGKTKTPVTDNLSKTPSKSVVDATAEKHPEVADKQKSPVAEEHIVHVEIPVPEKPKEIMKNANPESKSSEALSISSVEEQTKAPTEDPATVEHTDEVKAKSDDSSKPSEQPTTGAIGKTVRKRRKNELASILSDQLLESFKEVDKAALQDLKMMHDMSCEKPDIKFSLEQIPQLAKRKVNPRNPDLIMPVPRHSPISSSATKKSAAKKASKEVPESDQSIEVKDKTDELTLDSSSKSVEHNKIEEIEGAVERSESSNSRLADNNSKTQEEAANVLSKIVTEAECTKLNASKKNINKGTADDESMKLKTSEKPVAISSFKPSVGRRTRKLSIDIERVTNLERKSRQKALFSKEMESLDMPQNPAPASDKKGKGKISKKSEALSNQEEDKQEPKRDRTPVTLKSPMEAEPDVQQATIRFGNKSRSKTPFPFPKQKQGKKSDLDRLKDELNIETPSKKLNSLEHPSSATREATCRTPSPDKKTPKRKVDNLDKEGNTKDDDSSTPVKQTKEAEPRAETPISPSKRSKTPVSQKQRTPSPATPSKKSKTPTPPKRIMARRSSVFVDKNLSHYLEQKDQEHELMSNMSFKDDLILTSRRGTRSQGTVDMSLVNFFAEAAMKPRDPRRKSAAAVAAAAASAKRAEEDRKAAEEERKRREELELASKHTADTTKSLSVPRRISTRRNSVFITPSTEKEEVKAAEENLVEIVKATKRQYRRRASVYQSSSFLDEEEKQHEETTSKATRSKTPGPGGVWDNDIRSVGRRRNQSVFNGTPEPTIESLLEPLASPTLGTKRRTKNSQLAENLSKLFNIEEEIQLIDRSKRKPRKSNTPVVFDGGSALGTSTPKKDAKVTATQPSDNSSNLETNKIDELVKVVETEVAKEASTAPKPRESLSFSNDDEDETPKLNKLVEDIINKSETESDSDDDNMSLACFVRREESLHKPNKQPFQDSLEGIGEDESNSAMDDDVSVTTELTLFGGSIKKRKRRKSICVIKSRRPKPVVDENKPVVTYNCDLCKKVFKKQDAYNKHRMTLSHISKLSEQEYLEAQRKEQQAADASTLPSKEDSTSVQSTSTSIPPVASSPKDLEKDSAMKALSQEEKLFYECCSMLKESNADNENLNLTVSLKSDEMTPGLVSDEIPPPKVSVTYPNPFGSLPQDKAHDNCFNMGDSFPSFQDVSESENYIQTINQRYADKHLSEPFAKLTAAEIAQRTENDGNLSPQNSTKSTSSQASVFSQKTIKTKGALKGYDNFKVSIPMTGIHLGKESKLDTLADVALCGDIPKEFELKDSEEEKEGTLPDNVSQATQPDQPTAKDDTSRNGLQNTRQSAPKKEARGNKLGFRAKKKGNATPTKATAAPTTTTKRTSQRKAATNVARSTDKKGQDPDDVYAFQDSPPADNALLQSYTSNKKSTATVNKGNAAQSADQGEESQVSSLSFSDRDDFVYGTNTPSEEDEDDKSSSYSSTQTTPKKPIKADVQKKSLIMGRIFKKTKEKSKEETSAKNSAAEASKEKPKTAAKDFDKLFDTLKKSEADEDGDKDHIAQDGDACTESSDPKTLEEDEKGDRNLRRRSTQKKLTETWDSDEYEDFNLKDVVNLIDKKDGKVVGRKINKEKTSEAKGDTKSERKTEESLSNDNSEASNKEQMSTKAKLAGEKKIAVTDETIRQVMESVIMEVSMNKNNRVREVKKRGKGRPSKTSKDVAKEEESNQEVMNSSGGTDIADITPEDHVLESSVEISSKTITTKFKQKLNSAQTIRPKPASQKLEKQDEESKKTVNNNNQAKAKETPKAKEQRKDTPEVNKSTLNSAKLKQRKGPPKKMKNVAYDPDSDFEDNIKCKKVKKKLLESDIEANLKIEQLNAALSDSILMPAPRRKRNAAETLYFWSSSSEDDDMEENFVEVTNKKSKKKKGATKQKPTAGQTKTQQKQQQQQQQQQPQQDQQQKQVAGTTSEAGDETTTSSSEPMQQHGWIVGDSHKKLVNLLARAKGKQENRTVKATGNRRKT